MVPEMNSQDSETTKLLEVPKVTNYDLHGSKEVKKERVMAFLSLPTVTIPLTQTVPKESRVVEIYKITCTVSGKCYVGQAVSHRLNAGKYRRYGSEGRLASHFSESNAPSKRHKECGYLNNAIRKHGKECFFVEVVKACKPEDTGMYESSAIEHYNTLYPHGYNLRTGGQHFSHTEASRSRVSKGVQRFFEPQKIARFEHVYVSPDQVADEMLFPLSRNGKQYGWYVFAKDQLGKYQKADFGGVLLDLNESRENARRFVEQLKRRDVVITFVDEPQNKGEMGNQQPSSPVAPPEIILV